MTTKDEVLKPCPFCGAGTTQIVENGKMWTGMKYREPSSVSVRHWCEPTPGQPSRMLERVGKDHASAVAAWNTREALAHPAGETLSEDQSVLVDKLKALLTGPANLTTQEAGAVSDAIRALLSSDAQPAGERGGFIDRSDAVNLARNMMEIHDCKGITEKGVRVLCDAVLRMDAALLSSDAQPSEWVGLSDEEANELWESTDSDWELMKRTEAKLREKNAGKPAEDKSGGEPYGWLYDWTHSSATGKPDEKFTGFTKDEQYARTGVGHENVRPVYTSPQPQADEPFLFIYFDPTAGTHGSHRVAETHPPPADAFPVYTRPQPRADVPETNFGNMKGDKK